MPGLRPIDEIERRRAAQEVTDDLKRHNTDMWLSTERAKWEQKTHDKIVERGRRARIRKYDKEAEDELRRRRERLAKLYSEEMAQWRHEVATSGKSAADRKAEVEAKALELGRQREVARKKHNDWAYAQQRRNSLDDVRKRDSKAFVEACLSTRHLQHEEKARRLQKEKEEEEAWLKKWREGLAEADRVEAEKVAKHKAHEHDVKYVLDEQVELKKKRYRAREERMKKEAEEELAEWKVAVEAEAKKQIDLRDAARARSKDVMGFNSVFDQKKEVAKKEQLRRDKLTLQYELDLQKPKMIKTRRRFRRRRNSTRGSRSTWTASKNSKVRTKRRSRPCAESSRTASGRKEIGPSRPKLMLESIYENKWISGGSSRSGTRSPPRSSRRVTTAPRSRPSRRRRRRRTTKMIEGKRIKNRRRSTTSRN
jgi:hypothetical protein